MTTTTTTASDSDNPIPKKTQHSTIVQTVDQILEDITPPDRKTITPVSTGTASDQEVDAIANDIASKHTHFGRLSSANEIKIAIAELVQQGATSPKFAETRMSSFSPVNITVGELRAACRNRNTTVRRVARNLADLAYKVGKKFDIPGNLSRSYMLQNPNCSREELYWVSDFQTFSANSEIPDSVKEFLLKNYSTRFRKTN